MFPFARDVSFAVSSGRQASSTPLGDVAQGYAAVATDVLKALNVMEGKPSKLWLQHALDLPGYSVGIGTRTTSRASQFLFDTAAGKQHPQDGVEYLRGLITGKAKAHK
jgi:hypothetical protein